MYFHTDYYMNENNNNDNEDNAYSGNEAHETINLEINKENSQEKVKPLEQNLDYLKYKNTDEKMDIDYEIINHDMDSFGSKFDQPKDVYKPVGILKTSLKQLKNPAVRMDTLKRTHLAYPGVTKKLRFENDDTEDTNKKKKV